MDFIECPICHDPGLRVTASIKCVQCDRAVCEDCYDQKEDLCVECCSNDV